MSKKPAAKRPVKAKKPAKPAEKPKEQAVFVPPYGAYLDVAR